MNKKAGWGTLAAAIAVAVAVAYGGGTWWAGTQIQARYGAMLDALPQQTSLVRVIERDYQRGFSSAVATMTLEVGCAVEALGSPEDAEHGDPEGTALPPAPTRITVRNTIHHGPLAGWSLAAATIDSELVLDAPTQAQADKLFGQAQPLTAHTRVAFDGAFSTDLIAAPAALNEDGKDRFTWQGARLRLASNAQRTQARYEFTMPGFEFTDARHRVHVTLGPLSAKSEMDVSDGAMLATGKSEGRMEHLSVEISRDNGKALPMLKLQGVAMEGGARIQDGLYGSTANLRGSGKIGETAIESFEMRASASRLKVDGYRKLANAWMQSSAASGCGQSGSPAAPASVQALLEQLEPDLKAMAKYGPTFGVDKMQVEIGGKRGEMQYMVGLAGVTDEDLQIPGTMLLMQRGVLTASATLPVSWLEKMAETMARPGKNPTPEIVAHMIDNAANQGFLKRDGDNVRSQIDWRNALLKVNGEPLGARSNGARSRPKGR